jgi:CRISPR-associated protein Cas2
MPNVLIDIWWEESFPLMPREWKAPGNKDMLILIAYDICQPRRLSKVAKTLEDYGFRVQYSLFECRLEDRTFAILWDQLNELIDPEEDKLVAYRIDAKNARQTMTAGQMSCSEKVLCYII